MASMVNFNKHLRKNTGGKQTWKTEENILLNSLYEASITLLQIWDKDNRRKRRPTSLTTIDTNQLQHLKKSIQIMYRGGYYIMTK